MIEQQHQAALELEALGLYAGPQKAAAEYDDYEERNENLPQSFSNLPTWAMERSRAVVSQQQGTDKIRRKAKEERDEAGFFADDKPLQYVPVGAEERDDGLEYEVAYKMIAIRKEPHLQGKVLGAAAQGERMLVYDWDPTKKWRKIHYRLRGGWGGLVYAWVMIQHPELGELLREAKPEVICICGKAFADDAAFCSACGARRPEQDDDFGLTMMPRAPLPQPKGWLPPSAQPAARRDSRHAAWMESSGPGDGKGEEVVEGNMVPLTGYELSLASVEGDWSAASPGTDGCRCISSKDLQSEISLDNPQEFEVIHRPCVYIRNEPSTKGRAVGITRPGQRLDTFGWDETKQWRKLLGNIGKEEHRIVVGWINVFSPEHGQLLQVVGGDLEMDMDMLVMQ